MHNHTPSIPEDVTLDSQNIKELTRSFKSLRKLPSLTQRSRITPYTSRTPRKPSTPFQSDFTPIRRFSRPRGPNSALESFATTTDTKSSLVVASFEGKLRVENKDALEEPKQQATEAGVPQVSLEDEANHNILPATEFCHVCGVDNDTEVEFQMPTLSLWKRVCCIGDVISCCSTEKLWMKYGKYIHKCSKCNTVLKKHHPNFI